ncbi:MAG: oligoendopeptidase F [Clostridia bacterium]|nr:oligoendopeptidase F [Clostridia bacterium]MBQ1965509.1 oligoendopeptidase F [Clostridia bacterium]
MKLRHEIDPKLTWDLSQIYTDDAAWEVAYAEACAAVETIPAIKGTLAKSADDLKKGLDVLYGALEKAEKVYVYTMLRKSLDNGDAKSQEMSGRAMMLFTKLSAAASFLEPEILAMDGAVLAEYLNDPVLAGYKHIVQDIDRARPHTLDEEKEKMLALLSEVSSAADEPFDMFESVDMTFPTIKNEKGEEVTLSHGNFGAFRESNDRNVRKESFEKYFGEFKKYINTIAAIYGNSVKFDNYYTKVRGYETACHKALFASNIPVSVYDNLVNTLHDSLPIMKRYLELRKTVLGLDELHMYDLYCPIVSECAAETPYEEAKEMVKEACAPLGQKYLDLLDRAYNERWIDVYETKGKTTGAYSCGVHGVHPYVLLNYSNTFDDAFTLAHELGHAMHSYFSSEKQDFANHDYKIFVAEVASTVNEVLMTRLLLAKETDPAKRAYLLNHFLEGFRTTVFRQTLFAEFERKAHDLNQQGVPLTADVLNKTYRELNELYYNGAVVDELQDIEWARIPHFYRAFYVYQYATSFCASVAVVRNILETGDASKYLEFLATGGSDYPINELKIAGIDMTDPAVIQNAMKEMDSALTELEGLLLK